MYIYLPVLSSKIARDVRKIFTYLNIYLACLYRYIFQNVFHNTPTVGIK